MTQSAGSNNSCETLSKN
jgi:hypothetical protein